MEKALKIFFVVGSFFFLIIGLFREDVSIAEIFYLIGGLFFIKMIVEDKALIDLTIDINRNRIDLLPKYEDKETDKEEE